MVLRVKDFTWTQNDESVFINIPLKGKPKNQVDIVLTDSYIKVNFQPYIFECFLSNPIEAIKSRVVFIEGVLMFSLRKTAPVLWNNLNNDVYETDDKEKAKLERLKEIEKFEIKLEAQEKDRIKNYKESETRKALEDLDEWKKRQISSTIIVEKNNNDFPCNNVSPVLRKSVSFVEKPKKQVAAICHPSVSEIRKTGRIEVSFTPRVFPTPERESVKDQEDEWLKKQLAHKQHHNNTVTADMKPEENNPDWLRAKGNSLFAAGDYEGALAAFSLGLELNHDLYELYSNRAACHIKLRNFFRAVDDASAALCLLDPPVAQNRLARIRAHLRRGAAFCQLEMYREGLLDYEAALRIDPDNEAIRADIARLTEAAGQ